MKNVRTHAFCAAAAAWAILGAPSAMAQSGTTGCNALPKHADVAVALQDAVNAGNGGFGLQMWATLVDRDGIVCVVAFSGRNRGDQWPGSRVISAQKANTANAFSLPGLALSTANLYTAVQPGGSLFGLQESNPVNPAVAYATGRGLETIGRPNDPMVGGKIGGVNVFGGGLPLYSGGTIVGALGVSGDSSCADHNIAWRVRVALGLEPPGPIGVGPGGSDGIVYYESPWRHPVCGGGEVEVAQAIGAGTDKPRAR